MFSSKTLIIHHPSTTRNSPGRRHSPCIFYFEVLEIIFFCQVNINFLSGQYKSHNARKYKLYACFFQTFPDFYVQLRRWFTCNIALCATLHYMQHCIKCNIALRAILQYVLNCITWNIALVELSSKLWIISLNPSLTLTSNFL